MALIYIYSDSTGSTIDITDRCRVIQLSVKDQAEEGAVAISSLIVDDPDGDIIFTGHRRFYIYEDTAPVGNQLIYNGFTANERVIRGPSGRTGASRQWVLDLADVNVLINRRIMNGADANRPAETDLARIQALLTMTELNTVDDDSFVNTTADTVDMDAADYRGQNVGQYIDDCRQASGKNAYIYYNETLGEYGLWYDFASSTEYDSGMFLSNDIGLINNTTVFPYSLERTYSNNDPSRVASGIYLEYDGGLVYAQDAGTTAEFAAIDWAAPSVNVKTLAKATARANRYLADAATEHTTVHTVAMMPRTKVTAIKKGQLVQFHAAHLPGFASYRTCRILNTTINEISEDPTLSFEIEMDLDPQPAVFICPTTLEPGTAEGFYGPLLGIPAYGYPDPRPGGGPNVHYLNSGVAGPTAPDPNHTLVDNWGFPVFAVAAPADPNAPSGYYDTAIAGGFNTARCLVVGPGTATVYVPVGYEDDGSGRYNMRLNCLDGVAEFNIETRSNLVPGTPCIVEVPASVEGITGTICNFWIDIELGSSGTAGIRSVGFGGFDWVPA